MVGACIPRHNSRIVAANSLVRGNSVELVVCSAGGHDVDGGGRVEERGVVPGEGYVGADFVVL